MSVPPLRPGAALPFLPRPASQRQEASPSSLEPVALSHPPPLSYAHMLVPYDVRSLWVPIRSSES